MRNRYLQAVREAMAALEEIDAIKLAAQGLSAEATAISKARIALDKLRFECGGYYCDEDVGHIDCEQGKPDWEVTIEH